MAGDVDGDGHPDLIVGSWQYSAEANSGGRAYLFSGKDGTLVKTFTCRTPGDTFDSTPSVWAMLMAMAPSTS